MATANPLKKANELQVQIKVIGNGYLVLTEDEEHYCPNRQDVMSYMEKKLPVLLRKLPDRK